MTDPYQDTGQLVTANGIEMRCALDGPHDAPVLALVNPASHNLTCWEPVLEGLTADFRVLRFDIRGTGRSGWGNDDGFTFSQYADDLAALLDALQIPRVFVLGVAYGARTAARFALRHPDRLTALGLFDVSLAPPVGQDGQRALGHEARELLRQAGEPAVEPKRYWRFYEDREAARKAHTAHEQEPDLAEFLGGVPVPMLVACGRQDMNLAEAERIAGLIPGAEFRVMEMTGHGSPFYRPGLFVELVRRFAATHGLLDGAGSTRP